MTGGMSTLMGPGFFMFFQQEATISNDGAVPKTQDDKDLLEMLTIVLAAKLFEPIK